MFDKIKHVMKRKEMEKDLKYTEYVFYREALVRLYLSIKENKVKLDSESKGFFEDCVLKEKLMNDLRCKIIEFK